MKEMKILGETIPLNDDYIDIYALKFLQDNPRVYACIHEEPGFSDFPPEKQQEIIYEKLLKEPSVKNLIPEIKQHGGLMECILVRRDTMDVIEGNSRLAVYRKFHEESQQQTDEWSLIPCDILGGLTDRQQAAFLNQIHVKGKTQWSAYEKANFAYVRKDKKWKLPEIAKLFGESEPTIRVRVKAIEMMHENTDNKQSHFSYYEVLARNPKIEKEMQEAGGWENLLKDIKGLGTDEETNTFTSGELRNNIPVVLKKPKVLKKYVDRKIDLDNAYQRAKIAAVEENVRKAMELLQDVTMREVETLEKNKFNAFKQSFKKLERETDRIKKMTASIGKDQ